MTFEVLLSCMNQTEEIIEKSNLDMVQTLVINQCGVSSDEMVSLNEKHRMYQTGSRGLSNSRNLALKYAEADIVLLSDDDEIFDDNLSATVCKAFEETPEADVLVFRVRNCNKKLGDRKRRLSKVELLRVASVQIAFRLESIRKKGIAFDPLLGAGTTNGSGEETKFIFDCYRKGLSIWFVPISIGTLEVGGESTWFHGYNPQFFYNQGKVSRYIYGVPFALLYNAYFMVFKHKIYQKEISFFSALKHLIHGMVRNDLRTEKNRERVEP